MKTTHSIPTPFDLIETCTTRKIFALLNGTAKFSQFSFLFGPSGYRKTFTAKAWLRNYGNGACVRAETHSSQAGIRRGLSSAIFGDEKADSAAIRQYLREHPGFVLVVDECNHLIKNTSGSGANALDSIRDYYDSIQEEGGRFGVCFVFTNYSLDRLRNCRMSSFLEQFINRGDNHLSLPAKISRNGEIAPVIKTLIPYADDALIDAAATLNDFRAVFKRIAVLKDICEPKGIQITAPMLIGSQATFESGVWEDKQ